MTRAYCVRCREWVDASRIDPLEIACREHSPAYVPEWQRLKSIVRKRDEQRRKRYRRKTA